jgi:hypothetical protein
MLPQSSGSKYSVGRKCRGASANPLTPLFTYSSRAKTDSLQTFPKYYLSIALFDFFGQRPRCPVFLIRHHTKTLAGDSRIRLTS